MMQESSFFSSPSCFLFYCWLFAVLSLHVGPLKARAFTGTYGINYGRIADNLPPPESVVTLLKAAKIKNVRIFDADHSVLEAFKGSGLELVVGLPNEYLKEMSVNEDRAMSWLKENVQKFLPDTHIRGIAIGNEVLAGSDQELQVALLGACKNVYNALDKLQLADLIQVSTAHSEAVFANSYPPSSCTFKEDVLPYMKPLLDFLSKIGSPFFINAYPFLAYKSDPEHIDIKYALFESNSGVYDAKTELHYYNMFDAQIDAAYAALEAVGFDKMEVRISETGWASDGDKDEAGATVHNARTYNYNLRKRLLKKKGTPRRPKATVKAYVFALFNENLKPGPTSERHFGLFKADGSIAYDIGFTVGVQIICAEYIASHALLPEFYCGILKKKFQVGASERETSPVTGIRVISYARRDIESWSFAPRFCGMVSDMRGRGGSGCLSIMLSFCTMVLLIFSVA